MGQQWRKEKVEYINAVFLELQALLNCFEYETGRYLLPPLSPRAKVELLNLLRVKFARALIFCAKLSKSGERKTLFLNLSAKLSRLKKIDQEGLENLVYSFYLVKIYRSRANNKSKRVQWKQKKALKKF